MVKQDNVKLLPIIQNLGCLFLSLGCIAELETGYKFKPEDVNSIWILAKASKYIDGANRIVKPDNILQLFVRSVGFKLNIYQVGQLIDDKIIYWNWVKPENRNYKYCIHLRLTKGIHGTHFILCDSNKQVIFDSYDYKDYAFTPSNRYDLYSVI